MHCASIRLYIFSALLRFATTPKNLIKRNTLKRAYLLVKDRPKRGDDICAFACTVLGIVDELVRDVECPSVILYPIVSHQLSFTKKSDQKRT